MNPLDRIGGGFFQPDLTAFDHIDTPHVRIIPDDPTGPARPIVRPGRQPKATGRDTSPSKRADQRAKEREAARRLVAPTTILTVSPGKKASSKTKRASPVVTHEVRPARVERAHANCKERPSPTPKRGGGSGKKFVPWCSRK